MKRTNLVGVVTLTLVVLGGACSPTVSDPGGSSPGAGGTDPPAAGTGGGAVAPGTGGGGVAPGTGGSGVAPGTGGGAVAGTGGAGAGGSSPGTGGAGAGAPDTMPAVDRMRPSGPGKIVLVAGGLSVPFGVAVDPMTGDIYSADYGDDHIRRIDAAGKATVVLGPGAPGEAGQVTMRNPHDLLFQPKTRNLFVADTMASRVLRLDVATGKVTVIAGGSAKIPAGGNAFCLAFDPAGETLYFTGGGGIRVVDLKTETLKTTLNYGNPRVITVDSKGTLYAVKNGGNALQTVDAEGRGTNVPGGSPVAAPKRITTDNDDNVIIVDTESHSITRYDLATKSLVKLVGNGRAGTGMLDGPPTAAQTDRPHGAFVDAMDRILIADSFNDRIIAIVY